MQYLVIIEEGPTSFGAYLPDLPGCVAVGSTRAEVSALIHEAIEFHIEGMKEDGLEIPRPTSRLSTSKFMPNPTFQWKASPPRNRAVKRHPHAT